MYPLIRTALQFWRFRNAPRLGPAEEHRTTLRCLPWDLDPWMELNNGRTLTLMDLGRIVHLHRAGVFAALRAKGWGLAIAGCSMRYRRRITVFQRLELRSRLVGWDARFLYVEQSLWRQGDCASHGLFRLAVAGPAGIVPPAEAAPALGLGALLGPLPDWVGAWAAADAERPWPPMAG